MYEKFINELKDNSKPIHYIYYYEGKKLENKGAIRKDKYLRDLKDITNTVQKKLRIIKFPECVCNDFILDLENNQLNFYGFKYKHINDRRYDDYIREQRIIGPE